jgi:hypothetical protein
LDPVVVAVAELAEQPAEPGWLELQIPAAVVVVAVALLIMDNQAGPVDPVLLLFVTLDRNAAQAEQ